MVTNPFSLYINSNNGKMKSWNFYASWHSLEVWLINALDFALFLLVFISVMILFFVKFINRPKRRWTTINMSKNHLSLNTKWKTNEMLFEPSRSSIFLYIYSSLFTSTVSSNNEWPQWIKLARLPRPMSHQIQPRRARARWIARWVTASPTTNSLRSALDGWLVARTRWKSPLTV